MDHGSLYDLLHNETVIIEGEQILPMLRDITQGIRFLHATDPQVIHGDIKAQNILVSSSFRAKVSKNKENSCWGAQYFFHETEALTQLI